MKHNELFERLQKSSPQLAKKIAQTPAAMAELNDLEMERIVVEFGSLLEEVVTGLTIEKRNE